MSQYTYNKSPVNVDRLTSQILSSGISGTLNYCSVLGTTLDIFFDSALSNEDETLLNNLVNAHLGNAIPEEVTPRQIRQALILSGVTMQQITDALNALPSPQKELALTEWEYSTAFFRTNALVSSVGAMLGWTNQQLDDLWVYAGTL